MYKYKISYFPENGTKRTKFVIEEDALPFMQFVSRIRGLQTARCQGSLPGIVGVHLGPILIEELTTEKQFVQGKGLVDVPCPPAIGDIAKCYLLIQGSNEELNLAREAREQAGVVGMDIPHTIKFLAEQLTKTEKELLTVRTNLRQLEQQIAIARS